MKTFLFTIQEYIRTLFFGGGCISCHMPGMTICTTCLTQIKGSKSTDHPGIYGLFDYGNATVSKAIWALKYRHHQEGAKLLAFYGCDILTDIVSEELQIGKSQEIVIVPVPQHKKKTRARGFNQSILIATWISQSIEGARIAPLLEKMLETLPQSHLKNKTARLHNVRDTMRATTMLDKRASYLIVDDVTTTGATFLEAKRALKAAGAKHILCIALAHGYKKR